MQSLISTVTSTDAQRATVPMEISLIIWSLRLSWWVCFRLWFLVEFLAFVISGATALFANLFQFLLFFVAPFYSCTDICCYLVYPSLSPGLCPGRQFSISNSFATVSDPHICPSHFIL